MVKDFIKKTFIFVVASCSLNFFIYSKELIIGGKEGWPQLQYEQNVTKGQGRYGYESIRLQTNSFVFDETTDLLIDFEDPVNPISNGAYNIVDNGLRVTDQTKNEKYAGLSRNSGGLVLEGQKGTLFGTEGLTGSFALEFWLCPSISENGEVVIKWNTTKKTGNRLIYQIISAVFNKGHLEWEFSNIFESFGLGKKKSFETQDIKLKGSKSIIPETWSYHVLSFDSETGCLEYLVDGITEDILYMTDTGNEGGEISLAYLGSPSLVQICPEYTGQIDEIRFLRRPYSPPDFQSAENAGKVGNIQYVPEGGYFITKPIRLSAGCVLNSIKADMNIPEQTAVCLYVRSGDNYYNWNDSTPQWKAIESEEVLSQVSGLYFQIKAELFPDGGGEKTPYITQLILDYTELPEPLPPFVVSAEAGNASVTIKWNHSVDDTAGGYYLYYGNRPGEYLGRIAIEGESPIDVGNRTSFTLTGLENGRIYYFAVAAWSAYNKSVVGSLSKEVFARPLARLN